jgi:uncharacterized protein (DUF4415 family)
MARDMSKEPQYGTPDGDTPELTETLLARARPFSELAAERGISLDGLKGPHRVTVTTSVEIPVDIVNRFKADGDDWEMRIRQVLQDHMEGSTRRKKSA